MIQSRATTARNRLLRETVSPMGAMAESDVQPDLFEARTPMPGKVCRECGSAAFIRKDGCDFCTA